MWFNALVTKHGKQMPHVKQSAKNNSTLLKSDVKN